ncbi:MAG TPA: hypothetical protein VGF67_11115 [Ktedonobacteraceae bacterium]|jgi:hypothetical protein
MTALHPLLHKALQQLPPGCAILDWVHKAASVFVVSVPSSLKASDLACSTVHYSPPQLHLYPGVGKILDLPLLLSTKAGPTLPISLLLNPDDIH